MIEVNRVIDLEWMNNAARYLWQGRQVNIEEMTQELNHMIEEITTHIDAMRKKGIEFPMEYISNALQNYQTALEERDSYLLADCIAYEIREIAIVYNEMMVK